jgi:mono/diheme cytochrome c family protein
MVVRRGPDTGGMQASPPDSDAALTDASAANSDAALPEGSASLPGLCARPGDDAVRDIFCAPGPHHITGLRQLQVQLGINAIPEDVDDATAAAYQPDPNTLITTMVFLGHSTALSGRLVSALNPRVLILGKQTFMAFQRGVQQVELVSVDRTDQTLNFYLVSFRQTCNVVAGCLPGDLYTPAVERDWTEVEIRDDEDLKNTPSDCRQCHQRGRETPMLLMRELRGPWTHFFRTRSDPMVQAFQETRGSELYAGIPSWAAAHTIGNTLENLVQNTQPLEFASAIEAELTAHDAALGPRRSATWDKAYQAFKRGEQLALPHFEPIPTDPNKQAKLSQAYQRYRSNELSPDQLPDLADIFPDDPQVRAEIGLQIEPQASAPEALIQSCGQCHNDALDQSVSRARFNIALARMSRDELDLAIERIQLAPASSGVMPPPETRQLDAPGRARLIEYLRQTSRPPQDDMQLEQAAKLGMAKDPWADLIIYDPL